MIYFFAQTDQLISLARAGFLSHASLSAPLFQVQGISCHYLTVSERRRAKRHTWLRNPVLCKKVDCLPAFPPLRVFLMPAISPSPLSMPRMFTPVDSAPTSPTLRCAWRRWPSLRARRRRPARCRDHNSFSQSPPHWLTVVGGQTKRGQKGLWPLTMQPSLRVYGTRMPYLRSHGAK